MSEGVAFISLGRDWLQAGGESREDWKMNFEWKDGGGLGGGGEAKKDLIQGHVV